MVGCTICITPPSCAREALAGGFGVRPSFSEKKPADKGARCARAKYTTGADHRTNLGGDRGQWCADRAASSMIRRLTSEAALSEVFREGFRVAQPITMSVRRVAKPCRLGRGKSQCVLGVVESQFGAPRTYLYRAPAIVALPTQANDVHRDLSTLGGERFSPSACNPHLHNFDHLAASPNLLKRHDR